IAEWRGLPDKKLPHNRWAAPADVLPKLMQRLGLKERLNGKGVHEALGKIVSEFIAADTATEAVCPGILVVCVLPDPVHSDLEQLAKTEVLRKWKQRFGGKIIRDVRFRVG